jgi:hypothetical protein
MHKWQSQITNEKHKYAFFDPEMGGGGICQSGLSDPDPYLWEL